jgi:predicted transposase YbfD/YdcC
LTGAFRPPAEATVRRVLARVDPDALDQAIGAWLAGQQLPPPTRPPPAPRPRRQAVAVDGKSLRGSGHHHAAPVHLFAAMDHATGGILSQTEVDTTTNEIARFQPLLQRLDLTDTVVGADALHTQREHADWLVTHKHADYLLLVKATQPTLHQQLRPLPWQQVPVADHTRDRGHGRVEVRRLQVTTIAGLDFPHATQALPITRRVRPPCRPPLAHRDGECGHQPHRRSGKPRPPGRLRARPLGYRGVAPPPRCHLRRGRLPGPHRHPSRPWMPGLPHRC